ncbi:MAG: NUDIX domain-containing protein, partial [Chloroflexi bacterium]|nr:NUDIX domain-containing protein [Chloroflexota bacterium]
MVADDHGLPIVAAVALRRADGRVLLVRHTDSEHTGAAEGRWTLPAEPVADDEVVETALARLLAQRLHLSSENVEFSESVGLPGAIANVFTCTDWSGDPAYSADDYADAAWAAPHAPGGVDLPAGVREYLASAFPAPQSPARAEAPQPRARGDTPQSRARGDTPRAPARAVPAVGMPPTRGPKKPIPRQAPPPLRAPLVGGRERGPRLLELRHKAVRRHRPHG